MTALAHTETTRKAGHIARVPILIGSVADEGIIFVLGQNDTQTYLETAIPDHPELYSAILDAYPIPSLRINNAQDQVAAIETDLRFQCPMAIVAQDSSKLPVPTWRYFFNVSYPNLELFPGAEVVYHAIEVPLVFGTYSRINATMAEAQMSQYLQTSWANFAKNPQGGPGWKPMPDIAVLGTASKDLLTYLPPSAIDRRCSLYTQYYLELGTIAPEGA